MARIGEGSRGHGCGIPVLARPHAARIEQLGENYPLFYETAQDVERLLVRLERDPRESDEISAQLLERSSRYSEPEVARRLKREFERLFDRIQRRREADPVPPRLGSSRLAYTLRRIGR